jgi:protein PhnA
MAEEDEDFVYDEASGEWIPASQAAAEAGAETVEVRDAVGTCWRTATR